MRPLVVGPSPVITPSRTMPRAYTATSRSPLFDISTAPISSSGIPTKADIVLFSSFSSRSQHFHAGANEWLTLHPHFGHIDLRAESANLIGKMKGLRSYLL